MWCQAANTHLKLLDRVVSDASFLTGGVFECDLAHRRSVAVLCILYKIRYYQMHPLYGALSMPCVSVRVTRSTVIAHRYTYAPPRCRPSQYLRTFIRPTVSLSNDLGDQYSMVRDLRVSRAGPMPFYWPIISLPFCLLLFSPSLFFHSIGWYCGAGVSGLIGC